MAKYLILIYGNEQLWDELSSEEQRAKTAAHVSYAAAAGVGNLEGYQLQGSETATSLHATAAGEPTITDGPFLETKEVLGGYYVLEVPDLDAAITLARMLPEVSSNHGGVEIRPIVERD